MNYPVTYIFGSSEALAVQLQVEQKKKKDMNMY